MTYQTRAVVLDGLGKQVRGVKIDHDGGVELGSMLVELLEQEFGGEMYQLADCIIHDHPQGWVTLAGDIENWKARILVKDPGENVRWNHRAIAHPALSEGEDLLPPETLHVLTSPSVIDTVWILTDFGIMGFRAAGHLDPARWLGLASSETRELSIDKLEQARQWCAIEGLQILHNLEVKPA